MTTKGKARGVGLAVALLGSAGAQAHHSYATFDRDHMAALSGTVKSFDWTNPHTHVAMMVPTAQGGSQEWDLEGGPVNQLVREGLTKNSLRLGMKVKVEIAPRKDGQIGGALVRVLEIEGKPVSVPGAGS